METTMKPALKPGDVHVVINDFERMFLGEAKCYTAGGALEWIIPAICKGVNGPRFDVWGGDTPPGLYLAGTLYETKGNEPWNVWSSYGKWCIDLEEQEGQEATVGRAGICWHGGDPDRTPPLQQMQQLTETYGCVRSHNRDLDEIVIPTLKRIRADGDRMWITVNQIN